jgi:hypothetical protein
MRVLACNSPITMPVRKAAKRNGVTSVRTTTSISRAAVITKVVLIA